MIAYLGLGSNLGDREAYLADAVARLGEFPGITVTAGSPVYETRPAGPPGQPEYLNAVVAADTALSPPELLHACAAVESALYRRREERWGPRTIDIDILLCGDMVVDTASLTLPHPRMTERDFVLQPLCDIAPDISHPLTHRTIREHLAALSTRYIRTMTHKNVLDI